MGLAYILKRLLRRHVPSPVVLELMKYCGRSAAAEDRPDDVFRGLQDRLQELAVDLTDKHVLDLGSGRYARMALRLLNAGASRVTLIDFHAVPLSNSKHRELLERDCRQLGMSAENALNRIDLQTDDFLTTSPPTPEARADLILSTATLEHVQNPLAVFQKSWEWLRPGGFTSHVIDLRDHLFNTPFEMLTFSETTWKQWLAPKGGFHLNRYRLPDYLQAMRAADFVEIEYQSLQQNRAALQKIWPRLRGRFRQIDFDLLSIVVVHLYARKPVC